MTKSQKLSAYVSPNSQQCRVKRCRIAEALGLTPGAVSQMIKAERDIRIFITKEGFIQAFEIKPIGNTSFKSNQFSLKYDGKVSIEHEQ